MPQELSLLLSPKLSSDCNRCKIIICIHLFWTGNGGFSPNTTSIFTVVLSNLFRPLRKCAKALSCLGFFRSFTPFVNFAQKSLCSKALYPIFNRHRACCLSYLEFFRSFTHFVNFAQKSLRSKDLLRFLKVLGFLLFTPFVNFAQKSL